MKEIFSSPFFGISLCIFAYQIGIYINKKVGSPLANPMLIAISIIIGFLKIFNIPYDNFNQGGKIITLLLVPATACLGVSIYKQFELLKEYYSYYFGMYCGKSFFCRNCLCSL